MRRGGRFGRNFMKDLYQAKKNHDIIKCKILCRNNLAIDNAKM